VQYSDIEAVGVASAEIPTLSKGEYEVIVRMESIYYEAPDTEETLLTIAEPTRDFIVGGGWIWDENGRRSHFAFVVRYDRRGNAKGHLVYTYRDGDWYCVVKSKAILGLAIEEDHAFFEATAFIIRYNLRTGCMICSDGYRLRVDVWDKGRRRGEDMFQIRIYDPNGVVYHENGLGLSGYLGGGNIMIHHSKGKHKSCCQRKRR
jgi:hypothetical protein